jgi:tryptophan synthase alpha chain
VHIPVGVGFGIRDAATAQTIGKVADAVVIGSKLLQLIEAAPAGKAAEEARLFMHGIRQAMDA